MRSLRSLALAAGLLATPVHAQVTTVNTLSFGVVLAGTTTSIAPTSASAAHWRIEGVVGLGAGFSLTLPSTLARVGGGGSMPVTFCGTCGIHRLNNSNPTGGVTFNPQSTVSFGLLPLSTVYVWLGASVSPPPSQPSGSYVGTVILTYTGIL
jgi:hypothetical protein